MGLPGRTRGARILVALALLVTAGGVLAPSAPAAEIQRTNWYRFDAPVVNSAPAPIPPGGDPAWFAYASIPVQNAVGWFSTQQLLINRVEASAIATCNTAVKYQYFQSLVIVPDGVTVDTFAMTFDAADDGVRVTVFPITNPGPAVVAGYVGSTDPKPKTIDIAGALQPGYNRVVVTHEDNCGSLSEIRLTAVALSSATASLDVQPAPAFAGPRATALDVAVATVSSSAPPAELTAQISWGDDTAPGAGTIVPGAGGAPSTVRGTHTYAAAGTYEVTTTVTDSAASPHTGAATTTATVTTRPDEVQVDCAPGSAGCSAVPPPGPANAFAVTAGGGSAPAQLLARLNGGAAPDCAGYAERSADWVEFGFAEPAAGATWTKTVTVTRRTGTNYLSALLDKLGTQICFAAPYPFTTRVGYPLTGGPAGVADFLGVLPECSALLTVSVPTDPLGLGIGLGGAPTGPCVSARSVVPAPGGWAPRLEFRVPPSAQDPRGRS